MSQKVPHQDMASIINVPSGSSLIVVNLGQLEEKLDQILECLKQGIPSPLSGRLEYPVLSINEEKSITDLSQLPETLTVEQFATWQQISPSAVHAWARREEGKKGSPFYRVGRDGGKWRVNRDRFLNWRGGEVSTPKKGGSAK